MSGDFKTCPLEINSDGGFKQEHVNRALQPLKRFISFTTNPIATRLGRMIFEDRSTN